MKKHRTSGYRNHVKAGARAAAWDAVSKLVSPEMKRAGWVVVLAGKSFLDGKLAARRGFRNVIGVDIDSGVVSHNTEHGRVVVHRELSRTLNAWPDDKKIAVVWADFCSNLCSTEVWHSVTAWIGMKSCNDAVLFLNLLKGREFGGVNEQLKRSARLAGRKSSEIHRARAAVYTGIRSFISLSRNMDRQITDADIAHIEDSWLVYAGGYRAHESPMDWAIYKKTWEVDVGGFWSRDGNSRVEDRRHVAAKLAWHTMRKEAA